MGSLFLPAERRVDPLADSGCWIQVILKRQQLVSNLFRLELDLMSPLTPRSQRGEVLPRHGEDVRVELSAGVWWCNIVGTPEPAYLLVRDGRLELARSKAAAYRALGAVERLSALGLEDAAIALEADDFDHASVQVIAQRQQETDNKEG